MLNLGQFGYLHKYIKNTRLRKLSQTYSTFFRFKTKKVSSGLYFPKGVKHAFAGWANPGRGRPPGSTSSSYLHCREGIALVE
jgi:hypothetical protein